MEPKILLDDWLCRSCGVVFFTNAADREKYKHETALCPACGEPTRSWPSIKPEIEGVVGKVPVGIATAGNTFNDRLIAGR